MTVGIGVDDATEVVQDVDEENSSVDGTVAPIWPGCREDRPWQIPAPEVPPYHEHCDTDRVAPIAGPV